MPESWVTAPQTEEQAAYLQAEAVYRNFVYENYMAVNRNLTELMDVLFHAEEPDSDSTFSVLTHIREVLRTRCRYEAAGVEASADADPIAYFLTQSYRGNAALFAATAVEALRSYGIPARYAEGYRCTEEKLAASRGDTLALTGQDRHAWVEVYYDGIGWIAVDVTPGYYYDLVSLQRLVNLPNDVTKTADLSKNDTRADENSESDNPSSGDAQQEQTAKLPLGRLLSALGAAALLAAVLALLAELLLGILLLLLRRSFRRADALERAKRAEKVLFALLTAKGVQTGLGWNTEQLDAWLAETFPKVQPGEYTRVCELLEKSVYSDIPPEIYEERTIFALLRKLRGLPAGSGFRAQLRSRYGWDPRRSAVKSS